MKGLIPMGPGHGAVALLLLLTVAVVCETSARRSVDREDDDEQPWIESDGSVDGGANAQDSAADDSAADDPAADDPAADDPVGGVSYDDREQQPAKAECDADSFRKGQSECDRILRMNLPYHHGIHDYVCYALRKYKVCVSNVMIQSSCYERTFLSQELHKIRGHIRGYNVDCFNITKRTNEMILKGRHARLYMARVEFSQECSTVRSLDVLVTCTRDFDADVKELSKSLDSVKKSCRSVLHYYHCLSPVTESPSCQKRPDFVKSLEFFPVTLTARYKKACLKDVDANPALFRGKWNVTVEELMSNGACNEEEAAKEFLACVLVFNEVAMQNVMSRTCSAFQQLEMCHGNIMNSGGCSGSQQLLASTQHLLHETLYTFMQCKGQPGSRRRSGRERSGSEDNAIGVPVPDFKAIPTQVAVTTIAAEETRQYEDSTKASVTQPKRRFPFHRRIPRSDDYPTEREVGGGGDNQGKPPVSQEDGVARESRGQERYPTGRDLKRRLRANRRSAKKEEDVAPPESEEYGRGGKRFRRKNATSSDDGHVDEDRSRKGIRGRGSKKSGKKRKAVEADNVSTETLQTAIPNNGVIEDMEHMDEGDVPGVLDRKRRLVESDYAQ